jgi:hypothetical protein
LSKTLIFSIKKPYGGGIKPLIEMSNRAGAYEESGRIVVVPFAPSFLDSNNLYYTAPLAGTLEDHISEVFEAENVVESKLEAGSCIASVWRPGRGAHDDIARDEKHNLNILSDKQALLLLVTKLTDIFLTVEPNSNSMTAYGHRVRELHLLACMEVENYLTEFLTEGLATPPVRPSTNDYVQLVQPLYLSEYFVDLVQYPALPKFHPFENWNKEKPTKSIEWYNNYNKSKHNRRVAFDSSTLKSTIEAVAAVLALFTVRHGMHQFASVTDLLSLQVSQIMRVGINSSDFTRACPQLGDSQIS